jgi:hypothetical protein
VFVRLIGVSLVIIGFLEETDRRASEREICTVSKRASFAGGPLFFVVGDACLRRGRLTVEVL